MPLRTGIELYIEISLLFFLNLINNTKFGFTGPASSVAFYICLVITVFFCFLIFHILTIPPKFIRKPWFKNYFGMLTKDVYDKRTLHRRSYYALFIFHRLCLTGILVLGYSYPLLQILSLLTIQIIMIWYLMVIRPFRDELQRVITT